jgi:hypothetical protein
MNGQWIEQFPESNKYDLDLEETIYELEIDNLMGKIPLDSPAFIGTPTAPTAPLGTNTTQLATTEFIHQEIDAYNESIIVE